MDIVNQGLQKRYASEKRFRMLGMAAIMASMLFLALLFITIIGNGYTAFWQTFVKLEVYFDPEILPQDALETADYPGLVKKSLRNHVRGCQRSQRQTHALQAGQHRRFLPAARYGAEESRTCRQAEPSVGAGG